MIEDRYTELEGKINALLREIADRHKWAAKWENQAEETRLKMEALRTMALDESYQYKEDVAELTEHLNACYDEKDELEAILRDRECKEHDALDREWQGMR